MNNADTEYFRLLQLVLDKGRTKKNRTGIDTIGVFGAQARFDLSEGFPLLTTKKVYFKAIAHELLWFLSGSTNIKYLVDNDVHIWDEWAYKRFCETNKDIKGVTGMDGVILNALITQEQFISNIKNYPDFARKWGELGDGTYGGMWRAFPYHAKGFIPNFPSQGADENSYVLDSVDQIQKVLDKLKTNPDDRRLIVSAWHPYWVDHCALPPCHCLFQFHTEELNYDERMNMAVDKGEISSTDPTYYTDQQLDSMGIPRRRLNCQLYQRSCDLFLGVPFNIASYSLLLAMIAQVSGMVAGEFVHTYGDLHIYSNHLEQVKLQLTREPLALPTLELNYSVKNLFDFKYDDIKLINYLSHPAIKGEVAV